MRLKEPFSGWSHFVGAALALIALLVLLIAARGRALHLVGFTVYGISLVCLFLASALYHSLRVPPKTVSRLQRIDFIAIFLLIAGTYAPICLVTLRGPHGWGLLAAEYGLALAGIAAVAVFRQRFPAWLRVTLYAVMTWLAIFVAAPLFRLLSPSGFSWLLAGILTYTIGTVILAMDWPHLWRGRFSAHDLWHLFVIGGSACHFVLMLCYVAPAA